MPLGRIPISVACIAGLSGVAAAQAEALPYQREVDRWVECDRVNPIEPGRLLFAGSSSIRRWEALAHDFADYQVVQRGFGGSQLHHLIAHFDRIVAPYRPSGIVLWMGTNDLALGKSPETLVSELKHFVEKARSVNPEVHVFYLGVIYTPKHSAPRDVLDESNARIAAFAKANRGVHYIDLPGAFKAMPSEAWNEMFVDPRHVNRAGYNVWTSLLRPSVESVIAPNAHNASRADHDAGTVVLFDFGPSNPDAGEPTISADAFGRLWNNWIDTEAPKIANSGERVGDLRDVDGQPTGIAITLTGGFETNGKPAGGLVDPDRSLLRRFAVPSATQDFFISGGDDRFGLGNDDVPGGLMITGVDPALTYDLGFFGSGVSDEVRVTEYRVTGVNGRAAQLQTSGPGSARDPWNRGNDDKVAWLNGLRPTRFGQLFVDVHVVEGMHGYLNAMEIRAREPSQTKRPGE
ncbi:MAG: GDSL-type esterase/lipase family protein [Planctomycetota bacterium]